MMEHEIALTRDADGYRTFLKVKSLPRYKFVGHTAIIPQEYAKEFGVRKKAPIAKFTPSDFLFDYQRDIARTAVEKQKYSVFAECGLGKTLIMLEYARHVRSVIKKKKTLIVSPLMVVGQTLEECEKFYGDSLPIEQVRAKDLKRWIESDGGGVGITNYDAITDEIDQGNLGCLILDESSMLKSHYGKWGTRLLQIGRGLDWKLCLTGTPAPNDRIEYANHAVFMDQFPTVNSFLARYFVNRGMTGERWELKPHALKPFYVSLSHWCIFLSDPATYGWKDNTEPLPPIHTHIHDVDLTADQRNEVRLQTGELFLSSLGGIVTRQKLTRIARGTDGNNSLKPHFIRDLVNSWPTESTIIWCQHNDEQDGIAALFPGCANIDGSTPEKDRIEMIRDFKSGKIKDIVSKPKILGFGLNLQRATRQVFSGMSDSYEAYWQAVKRSNRVGSKHPLNVHIPVTEIEIPILENVLRKAANIEADTKEQQRIFHECRRG